jgi:hypothetical protein
MVSTRKKKYANASNPLDPAPATATAGIALAPQGGLSLNEQKKLFEAIEDGGGLFKVKQQKVFDSNPSFFGAPNSERRRQFRNRVNHIKNPPKSDPDPAAYYTFLQDLGVTPNLTGKPRSQAFEESDSEGSSTSISLFSTTPPPATPSSSRAPPSLKPAPPSKIPPFQQFWSSPQLLRSPPQLLRSPLCRINPVFSSVP